jgi:hypothetical protein
MKRLTPRRPSPAFVLAVVAVFASLGGTGYATSKTAKPLTKKQINKLIASYVKAHRSTLTGPAGSPGGQGVQGVAGADGKDGAAGPGATRIVGSGDSTAPAAQPVGAVGPWSFTLTCNPSNATFTVHGPGTVGGTTSLATGGGTANTYVGAEGAIGGGAASVVGSGAQMSQTLFLHSGSTIAEVKILLTALNPGLFNQCNVIGDAVPVP